jgi:hypothetical protein
MRSKIVRAVEDAHKLCSMLVMLDASRGVNRVHLTINTQPDAFAKAQALYCHVQPCDQPRTSWAEAL